MILVRELVSTHSRPKAAGKQVSNAEVSTNVSTHSRPKAAGYGTYSENPMFAVSTHSRPKAAGRPYRQAVIAHSRFNSQPPEGGWFLPQSYR